MEQIARSGSFLPAGEGQDLVLRGVGGSSQLSSQGGAAGTAVATAKLLSRLERIAGPEPYDATLQGAEVNPIAYSLRLTDPRFDGRTGTVRWRAEVTGGLPESVPASFGATALEVDLGIEAAALEGTVVETGGAEPVVGALVSVASDGLGLASTRSDERGEFRFDALSGRLGYVIEAAKPGFERSSVSRDSSAGDELKIGIEPIGGGE